MPGYFTPETTLAEWLKELRTHLYGCAGCVLRIMPLCGLETLDFTEEPMVSNSYHDIFYIFEIGQGN